MTSEFKFADIRLKGQNSLKWTAMGRAYSLRSNDLDGSRMQMKGDSGSRHALKQPYVQARLAREMDFNERLTLPTWVVAQTLS